MLDVFQAKDLEEAFHALNKSFTTESKSNGISYNFYRNDHFLNRFNIVIYSESHKNKICLEEIGYTKSKITHLLKSYLNPVEFANWINKITDTVTKYGFVDSDIVLRTTNNSKHGNGPCLLGFSFRSHKTAHMTVFSRSVELPQTYDADTLLTSAIASVLAEKLKVKQIGITWFIASARIRSRAANFYRLMIYPEQIIYANDEFNKHVQKQWDKILSDQEKKVTFSKLVKLQKEYKRVVIDQEPLQTLTGVEDFIKRLKKGDWRV